MVFEIVTKVNLLPEVSYGLEPSLGLLETTLSIMFPVSLRLDCMRVSHDYEQSDLSWGRMALDGFAILAYD